ncbi:hypothetical protein PHSY_004927 [Pseudozyma hubeiensis SY62]|uniref:Uncharacterized protein n=1 Tax=Pseudozyma hubeiensis (strain SY62) TaxID=1305764 RepID=R9P7Y9_PSEHS|nr:hypothetical protein PHSY_004927 [Pseudozyma hubeiensis SY62]GAC97342.1 hypothetical protein PHSY_004927 [Pseudozyma hubeiensis SY62]
MHFTRSPSHTRAGDRSVVRCGLVVDDFSGRRSNRIESLPVSSTERRSKLNGRGHTRRVRIPRSVRWAGVRPGRSCFPFHRRLFRLK